MNGSTRYGLYVITGTVVAIIMTLSVLGGVARAEEDVKEELIIGPDDEIYGSKEAADLVTEARKFDPMFCSGELADRDKAVSLYAKAIAAQPGAKLNAPIANRIAQMYAFYADKEKKVVPDRSIASQWWKRCIEFTSPSQLLWAQAQMGLASMAVCGGDCFSAVPYYNKILDMDISQVELPDWKAWPDENTEHGRLVLEQEQTRLRESVEGIQNRAAEKQFYVLSRISKPAALDALDKMASRYKGTPIGDKASKMMADIRSRSQKDPWALPEQSMDMSAPKAKAPVPLVRKVEPQEEIVSEPVPVPSAVTETDSRNNYGWGVAAFAFVGTAIVAVGIVWIRRRNHLDIMKGA